jgi:hypothetical protein
MNPIPAKRAAGDFHSLKSTLRIDLSGIGRRESTAHSRCCKVIDQFATAGGLKIHYPGQSIAFEFNVIGKQIAVDDSFGQVIIQVVF